MSLGSEKRTLVTQRSIWGGGDSNHPPNLPTPVHVFHGMDANLIQNKFEKLAARATIRPLVRNRWRPAPGPVMIDIGHDRHGEFFAPSHFSPPATEMATPFTRRLVPP